jgi:hypothetical protein
MKNIWLIGWMAIVGCSRAPSPSADHSGAIHAIYSGITLSTSLTSDIDGMPALRICLRNTGITSVDVVTGLIGYPVGSFSFEIALRDGRRFELLCDICAPAILGGNADSYVVELAAGHTWSSDIPLTAFLYVDSGDQHLDNADAKKALLITKIQGTWSPFENVRANQRTVWKGTASAGTTLPSFSRPVERWLAAAGAYTRSPR